MTRTENTNQSDVITTFCKLCAHSPWWDGALMLKFTSMINWQSTPKREKLNSFISVTVKSQNYKYNLQFSHCLKTIFFTNLLYFKKRTFTAIYTALISTSVASKGKSNDKQIIWELVTNYRYFLDLNQLGDYFIPRSTIVNW